MPSETVADVLAAMRDNVSKGYGNIPASRVGAWIPRIELAHAREIAEKDAEIGRLRGILFAIRKEGLKP